MTITVNTKAFTVDTNLSANSVQYTGAAHTFAAKDLLTLKRTAAKATSTFAGVARATAKFTRTVTLADGSKADAIVEASVSLPVGMVKADSDSLLDDLGDLLISTNGNDLAWKHDINQ